MAFTFHLASITSNSHSSLCLSPCPSCLSSDCPSVETQVVSDSWRKNIQNRGNNIGQRCLYLMCVFQWIIIVLLTPTRESASCRRTRPRPFSVPTLLREQTWSGVIRGQMITKEKCVTREHDADWNWRTSARLHSKQILKICCWVWGILVLSDNTRIIWLFWTFICSPRGEKKTNHRFETKFLFF